ncbi:murein biosynthesis integral membrane protein MurJ [Arthrobacter burdickii]|uniref:Murein biosynthesis integral membrane protein MurJ n=1 Tax=Arthrobacter burdickii TaxID=3035920 RepID=A0ABT8K091_9MICC|nr:murein biosynthesis integral membrane protein MurJ [Arthrobacter burdickii]MDN4609809.1 murein biosynthesis integral membrane protein MurJ [Arthrobacter burdickii]
MSETNTTSVPQQGGPARDPAAPRSGSTARSSAIMAAGTLVSRILGLVRVALLATAIGATGQVSDLFTSANNLPNFLYLMLAGGVFNAVLVPQIIRASRQPDRGADYVSRLLTLAAAGLLVLTVLVTLAAPVIVGLTTSVTGASLALTTAFAYWCLPQIFFYGMYAVTGQILNANGSFGPYMWAPVVNNVVSIAFLTTFILLMGSEQTERHSPETWTSGQTMLLAGGTTLGIVIQALVLFLPLKRLQLGLRPKFGVRGTGLGRTGKLASVTIVTMLIGNGLYLLNQRVATIASEARPRLLAQDPPVQIAGLTNLEFGAMVYQLPHSVIALSLATVMFNQLSSAHADNNLAAVRATLSQGLRIIGVATVFGAAALLTFAGPLGMLFSESAESAAINGVIIAILAVGAPFLSASFFLNRVFYASEDVRSPLRIQLILSVVGVVLALTAGTFEPRLIVPMLAVSYSLGNVIAVVVSHIVLTRKIGPYGAGHVFDVHVRLTIAGIAAAIAGTALCWAFGGYDADGFLWQSKFDAVLVLAIGGITMSAVYLAMLKLLKITELDEFVKPLLARFRRSGA